MRVLCFAIRVPWIHTQTVMAP